MAENDKRDPKKTAVALSYALGDEAPRVVASGKGIIAEKIIETAKENNVAVHEDSKLANTLSKLDIGEMIPPELYEVVAEILVFVDNMEKIRFQLADGTVEEFFIEEQTRIGGVSYLLVSDSMEDEASAYILKDVSKDTDPEACYEMLEDEDELQAVYKVFEQMLEDVDFEM